MKARVFLPLLVASFLGQANCSPDFSRKWHEEFSAQYDNRNVLYPRYKMCVKPHERPEKTSRYSQHSSTKAVDVLWADLLSTYTSDSGSEIYNWDYWKKEPDPDKSTHLEQVLALISFLCSFVTLQIVFLFLIPIAGNFVYKFYSLVWITIFHPEIRRICRRIYITKEKFVLKVWKPLVAKSGDKSHKQPKRQFRLPFILREFNEEEVPIELMQSEEEEESDGEGEVSSDGVENLLSNSKSKGRWSKAKSFGELVNTKALVQVLEEELGV